MSAARMDAALCGGALMQLDDAATILGRVEFLSICDAEQRRLLAFASDRKRYRPGQVIYAAGQPTEGAQVLVTGTVATYQDGDEENPRLVSAMGTMFGALSLVVTKPRPVTLKAVDQVETLMVPRSAFIKLCEQSPDLAMRAADRVRHDLSDYLEKLVSLSSRIVDKG